MKPGRVRVLVLAALVVFSLPLVKADVRGTDGFEDGDYTNDPTWSEFNSGGSSTVQTSTVLNGTYTLNLDGSSNDVTLVHNKTNGTIDDGEIYQAWVRQSSTSAATYYGIGSSENQPYQMDDHIYMSISSSNSFEMVSGDSSGALLESSSAGSPQSGKWYKFEIEVNVSSSTATGRVYNKSNSLLHTFSVNTNGASKLRYVSVDQSSFGSGEVYYDDVSSSSSNSFPSVNISTNPSEYQLNDDVDVTVNASDSDGTVDEVCAEAARTNTTTTQTLNQSCRTTSSNSVSETFTDFFTVSDRGYNYTVDVNATDDAGATSSDSKTRTIGNTRFTDAFDVLGNNVGAFNVTIDGETKTNGSEFITPSSFNATFSKPGWYNKTSEFNASLDNTFQDVYDHKATFTVEDQVTNNTINNHTIKLEYQDYQENQTTTNGTTTFNIEQNKTYNITISGDQVETTTANYTAPNNASDTKTFKAFTTRSALINVLDTQNRDKITEDVRIRLQSINLDREVQDTKTVSDGDAYFQLLEPARYRAQLNATTYTDNQFYFQVRPDSSAEYDFYMSKNDTTAPVTFTVIDQATNTLENVKVSIQRWYNETRTYETITEEITNLEGQATLSPPNDNEYYQVTFTRDGDTLRVTEPLRLLDSQYQIQVNLAGQFLEDAQTVTGVERSLKYNNASEEFVATYNQDGKSNEVCLQIQKIFATQPRETVDEKCTTSTTGTIVVSRDKQNITQQASITYQTQENKYTLETLTETFTDPIPRDQAGVFAQILISLFFAAASLAITPSAILTALPVSLYVGYWIGLITIPITTITGLLVAGATATYAVTKGGIR